MPRGTEKKEAVKELIRRLHEGEKPELVKKEFKDVVGDVTPTEIAQIEGELIEEGMPSEDVRRLCDVHLAVFREAVEKTQPMAPEGHPIRILLEEHTLLLQFAEQLRVLSKELFGEVEVVGEHKARLDHLVERFQASQNHYLREENVLFPYLEKHGITQPPAIMWAEHDQIRAIEKQLYAVVETRSGRAFHEFASELDSIALSLADMLSSHFYKEGNILFAAAMRVVKKDEWTDVDSQFDEIGYFAVTPERPGAEPGEAVKVKPAIEQGKLAFETGALSKEELEAMLNSLPVEITFVDEEDRFRFFNQPKEMTFVRSKASIGRLVQLCHPKKSVELVNQVIDDFRSGRKDVEEFWLNLKGKLIYIRYCAVRDRDGKYLGCMEVTENITEIKKIEGEKRL